VFFSFLFFFFLFLVGSIDPVHLRIEFWSHFLDLKKYLFQQIERKEFCEKEKKKKKKELNWQNFKKKI